MALPLSLSASPSLVTICDKSIIRPSLPTPSTLRYHKLSLIDQSLSNMYIPFAFLYPKKSRDSENCELSHIFHLLQKSLSHTLVSYYPYAGRLTDNATVHCNDKGAELFSTRIKCTMSEILNHPHADAENIVFPEGLPWKNKYEGGNLLVAQVSQFDCGGIAISACLSHKIGDGSSVANFFTDWASIFTHDANLAPKLFAGDSIFSPENGPLVSPQYVSNVDDCVQKRLIFPTANLDALRTKIAAESGVQNPTRAEVVSALLFKCATKATSKLTGSIRPSKLVHFLNVRPMIKPRSAIGNLLSVFSTTAINEQEMELPRIVRNLRNDIELACKKDQVEQNELVLEIVESMSKGKNLFEDDEYDTYLCSNICKFPFYSVDFGWGKPERVCLPNGPSKKTFFLKDYQTGQGIEAKVMLQKQHMSLFECDEELLEFALISSK